MYLKISFAQKLLLAFLLFMPIRCVDMKINIFRKHSMKDVNEIIENTLKIEFDFIDLLDYSKLAIDIIEALAKVAELVFSDSNIWDDPNLNHRLLSGYEAISLQLDHIEYQMKETELNLKRFTKTLPIILKWEGALDQLKSNVQPINNLYNKFIFYQRIKKSVEEITLLDFANSVVSSNSLSIQSRMAYIDDIVNPQSLLLVQLNNSHPLYKTSYSGILFSQSIFDLLKKATDISGICDQYQSPQQLVFSLYKIIALAQAKAYVMSVYGYDLLKYNGKGNFTGERQYSKESYMEYSKTLYKVGLSALQHASTAYRSCDPSGGHVENKTFIQITELLQGSIENEVDLNKEGTCKKMCSNYQDSEVKGCSYPDEYCGTDGYKKCKGKMHDCKFIENSAHICQATEPYKRYDWIKYGSGNIYGHKTDRCKKEVVANSWTRWFFQCSYCMCLCDDPSSATSDRFISLRFAVSDIENNKVMTGVRFVKKDRVVQMEIRQGTAIPRGQIGTNSHSWVQAKPISVESSKFIDGKDYFTLKYDARDIYLDHLDAPKGHVATGVRFVNMSENNIQLEMRVTPINFTTGQLSPENSFWIGNNNTHRYEVILDPSDDPTRNLGSSEISSPNMFVKLQPTSLKSDLSQHTIPFFDAQPVTVVPATWLEGIEIYHRGHSHYGGFIGFQIFNYNLSRHLLTSDIDKQEETWNKYRPDYGVKSTANSSESTANSDVGISQQNKPWYLFFSNSSAAQGSYSIRLFTMIIVACCINSII